MKKKNKRKKLLILILFIILSIFILNNAKIETQQAYKAYYEYLKETGKQDSINNQKYFFEIVY